MNIAGLQQAVKERAAAHQKDVVVAVFDRLRREHIQEANHVLGHGVRTNPRLINETRSWCECAYCQALSLYIQAKLRRHRIVRKMDREWEQFNVFWQQKDREEIEELNRAVMSQRSRKNFEKMD